MKDLVIGVLGGMGTYATINLFKQYAEVFPAGKNGRGRVSSLTTDALCQAVCEHFFIMKMSKD